MSYHSMSAARYHENRLPDELRGYEFTAYPETEMYGINNLGVRYFFPVEPAKKMVQWHKGNGSPAWMDLKEFWPTLAPDEQARCARFDIQQNKYI